MSLFSFIIITEKWYINLTKIWRLKENEWPTAKTKELEGMEKLFRRSCEGCGDSA